jgi:single-stranded-DNA-specific exonuclease
LEKRWIIKDKADLSEIEDLAGVLNIDSNCANLLLQRGIKNSEEAKAFFSPELADLHDPFLMKDMNIAVDRISTAMAKNERILIYGDYDVDGTTSVALLYSFFNEKYDNLGYYIPDRYREGYGISFEGIDYASENNYTLIIALDCGIKAVEKIDYANSKNIDFIICDHHLPGDCVPDAVAVLDPKRSDCDYPYKDLSGCGVGFKLLQAYARINNISFEKLIPYLDLVAVSIASDIVPVTGENRTLTYFGLKQLNAAPRTGLQSIINIAGMEGKELTVDDVVFRIGPRINAAGRMESGRKSVDLLITRKSKEAMEMSNKINYYNETRRNIDRNITQEALQMIAADPKFFNSRSTVLYNPEWHKGVIGIVASRLIETYYKPTVILTESNGLATGSARSVLGYDLYQAVDACGDLLQNFGGHMYAAGLTLKKENVEAFRQRFEEVVSRTITEDQLVPKVEIDAEIDFKDISEEFFRILKQFEPLGPGNMTPIFVSKNIRDFGTSRVVGSSAEHLKLELIQDQNPSPPFSAIAFNQAHKFTEIRWKKFFDICYSIEENEFRGKKTLQLNVKDIKTQST